MNEKETFYFAGKCLTLDDHPDFRDNIIRMSQNGEIDWEHFILICSDHLVLPSINYSFNKHNISDFLPVELARHLQEIFTLNTTRNKNILHQIKDITNTLNRQKIHPVFLKGAANLLDGLYEDPGMRLLGDIDFLVHERDYLTTAKTLIEHGYSVVKDIPEYWDVKISKHYPRMVHPDFESVIEVHRIPVSKKYLNWFNSEMIFKDQKEIPSHPGLFVPSEQHRLVHNFIHSQLANDGHISGVISIKELYDLYLLAQRTSLGSSLEFIKPGSKAIAYYAAARNILGLKKSFFPETNLPARILIKKHGLNLRSRFFFKTYRGILFIHQRIILGYFGQIIQAFYSKEKQTYLRKRIGNRKWYKDHMRIYSGFFKKEDD